MTGTSRPGGPQWPGNAEAPAWSGAMSITSENRKAGTLVKITKVIALVGRDRPAALAGDRTRGQGHREKGAGWRRP